MVDAFDSTKWVIEHSSEINGDSEKITVGGDSAGGNLAAVVVIMARDKGLRPSLKYQIFKNPFVGIDVASYTKGVLHWFSPWIRKTWSSSIRPI